MQSSGAYRFPVTAPSRPCPAEVPAYQKCNLPLRAATSRAGGYNPTRVHISGHVKEQFDPHPAVDPVIYLFYHPENIARIQQTLKDRGLGYASAQSLQQYMDRAMQHNRGLFHQDCHGDREGYLRRVAEHIKMLNAYVADMVRPIMESTKFGYESYYRDITMRRFPDHPQMRPANAKLRDQSLIHPYYYSMN